jgi:hypothetical protein
MMLIACDMFDDQPNEEARPQVALLLAQILASFDWLTDRWLI